MDGWQKSDPQSMDYPDKLPKINITQMDYHKIDQVPLKNTISNEN